MELFLQLNLDELPAELSGRFGSGLLQLFYCSWSYLECDGDRGWEAFANTSSLARVIIPSEETNCRSTANRYLPKRIVSWKKTIDRPDPIEHEELGIKIDYHFNTVPYHPTEMRCPELGLHFVGMPYVDELHDQVASHPGDKLGGWPHWVQGPEYPACPSCGKKMQFVFQIGSEDNIPFMFGDCGTGHVTQCQEHKDIVAFAWACC